MAIGLVVVVQAQDPITTIPGSYKVQFENEHVRVVRVHYPAGARLADHTHPAGTTAYVYLNDSDGVVFRHSGRSSHVVTRPPVKAGNVRVAIGRSETHAVENTSSTPSDFLRVQFKSDTTGSGNLRRRIARGSYPAGENATDMQFEDARMRITRLIIAPGKSMEIETPANAPALLIALTPAKLSVARASGADIALVMGQERWVEARQRELMTNTGADAVEMLRFDVR